MVNRCITPDALTPPAWRARGIGAGGIHKTALARSGVRRLAQSLATFAIRGRGSSSAPTGHASFFEIWYGDSDFEQIRDSRLDALFSPDDCAKIRALTDSELIIQSTAYQVVGKADA